MNISEISLLGVRGVAQSVKYLPSMDEGRNINIINRKHKMSNSEGDTGTQALPLCAFVSWPARSQQISLAMNSQGHDIFQKQWGQVAVE